MRHDIISDVMHALNNAENVGKQFCVVPASSLVKNILMVVQKEGYIGNFEFIDDGRAGTFRVELIGKINRTRAIRPRFPVKNDDFEKWESRYLPSRGFGFLIVSTPKGVMSQKDAVSQNLGGRIVGYVY